SRPRATPPAAGMRTRSASPRRTFRVTPTGGRRSRVTPVCSRACFGARERGYTDSLRAPVAQGIERCPAEAEVASSNLAGRMAQPAQSAPFENRLQALEILPVRATHRAGHQGRSDLRESRRLAAVPQRHSRRVDA